MANTIFQETFHLLEKDFQLPVVKSGFDEEKAVEFLAKVIRQMLDREFERFLQICYRIDLGEEKLERILHESEPDQVAPDLAKALWERQKMKVEIRRRYS